MRQRPDVPISEISVQTYRFPQDPAHSDGTHVWDHITLVAVEASGGGKHGIGYTYADESTATLIRSSLAAVVCNQDAFDVPRSWRLMQERIRNLGRPGIASMAISAVDVALWDLKAKLLNVPMSRLLGKVRDSIAVYGSGGLTSASAKDIESEFTEWARQGIRRFKMKVGRDPARDIERVRTVRRIIGMDAELFVDANGAHAAKEALEWAKRYRESSVSWFEEPVSSDDLDGLKFVRDHGPEGMEITAGEYGYDLGYFRRMLERGTVDVLQIDASRCGGISGFLAAAQLAAAFQIPVSSHTAPSLHLALCCAALPVRHLEYFGDHVAIERKYFDGAVFPKDGELVPDSARPGLGIAFRHADLRRFRT